MTYATPLDHLMPAMCGLPRRIALVYYHAAYLFASSLLLFVFFLNRLAFVIFSDGYRGVFASLPSLFRPLSLVTDFAVISILGCLVHGVTLVAHSVVLMFLKSCTVQNTQKCTLLLRRFLFSRPVFHRIYGILNEAGDAEEMSALEMGKSSSDRRASDELEVVQNSEHRWLALPVHSEHQPKHVVILLASILTAAAGALFYVLAFSLPLVDVAILVFLESRLPGWLIEDARLFSIADNFRMIIFTAGPFTASLGVVVPLVMFLFITMLYFTSTRPLRERQRALARDASSARGPRYTQPRESLSSTNSDIWVDKGWWLSTAADGRAERGSAKHHILFFVSSFIASVLLLFAAHKSNSALPSDNIFFYLYKHVFEHDGLMDTNWTCLTESNSRLATKAESALPYGHKSWRQYQYEAPESIFTFCGLIRGRGEEFTLRHPMVNSTAVRYARPTNSTWSFLRHTHRYIGPLAFNLFDDHYTKPVEEAEATPQAMPRNYLAPPLPTPREYPPHIIHIVFESTRMELAFRSHNSSSTHSGNLLLASNINELRKRGITFKEVYSLNFHTTSGYGPSFFGVDPRTFSAMFADHPRNSYYTTCNTPLSYISILKQQLNYTAHFITNTVDFSKVSHGFDDDVHWSGSSELDGSFAEKTINYIKALKMVGGADGEEGESPPRYIELRPEGTHSPFSIGKQLSQAKISDNTTDNATKHDPMMTTTESPGRRIFETDSHRVDLTGCHPRPVPTEDLRYTPITYNPENTTFKHLEEEFYSFTSQERAVFVADYFVGQVIAALQDLFRFRLQKEQRRVLLLLSSDHGLGVRYSQVEEDTQFHVPFILADLDPDSAAYDSSFDASQARQFTPQSTCGHYDLSATPVTYIPPNSLAVDRTTSHIGEPLMPILSPSKSWGTEFDDALASNVDIGATLLDIVGASDFMQAGMGRSLRRKMVLPSWDLDFVLDDGSAQSGPHPLTTHRINVTKSWTLPSQLDYTDPNVAPLKLKPRSTAVYGGDGATHAFSHIKQTFIHRVMSPMIETTEPKGSIKRGPFWVGGQEIVNGDLSASKIWNSDHEHVFLKISSTVREEDNSLRECAVHDLVEDKLEESPVLYQRFGDSDAIEVASPVGQWLAKRNVPSMALARSRVSGSEK